MKKYICKTNSLRYFTKGVVYEFEQEAATYNDLGNTTTFTNLEKKRWFKRLPKKITFNSKAEFAKALIKYKELWLNGNRFFYDENKVGLFWCKFSNGIEKTIGVFWERYGETFYTSEPVEEKKYPSPTNHELDSTDMLLTSETAAFIRLITWRDIWWKVDEWEPDWSGKMTNYTLQTQDFEIKRFVSKTQRVLAFKTGEIRDNFLAEFKDLIEECKHLI
jgi:hypothetical protein